MEGIASYEDWTKLDLRIAEIINIENINGADRLYKLTLDVGKLGERTVCAGIKKYYSPKELLHKKIIYLSNLSPKKLKGIESQGMLIAAGSDEEDTCVLISPEKEVEVGTKLH